MCSESFKKKICQAVFTIKGSSSVHGHIDFPRTSTVSTNFNQFPICGVILNMDAMKGNLAIFSLKKKLNVDYNRMLDSTEMLITYGRVKC